MAGVVLRLGAVGCDSRDHDFAIGQALIDARFEGGRGIFNAPEPRGPCTTAFYAERCDVGLDETSSFPTK